MTGLVDVKEFDDMERERDAWKARAEKAEAKLQAILERLDTAEYKEDASKKTRAALIKRAEKAEAELDALRTDGEKYRRLCELMKKYDAEVFWTSLGWRAFLLGSTSSVRSLNDPLEALEAAVAKAKEDGDDA